MTTAGRSWLRREDAKVGGWRGVLKKLATLPDVGIVSIGADHVFAAPVALGMTVIFRVVTDRS